jgi:imidazolonepropionase-like amidohydrolase
MSQTVLVRAGLIVGAAVLGAANDLGALAPNRLADIIGVRGNPLADISSLRSVSFVMKDGRVHRRDDEMGDL